jgi:hypothetical protein
MISMTLSATDPSAVSTGVDVYGLRIALAGWAEAIDAVRRDFAWFEASGSKLDDPHLQVTVEQREPDFDRFGQPTASFVTPRNVVYQQDARTIVDYFGKAVAVLDRSTGSLLVQSDNLGIAQEALYQFLLSRAGEHLDAVGFTRLHGLGLVGRQGAVAVMLPSGGGKTTLALRALRDDSVKLLSEDSPLLDRRGRLHPFPLRIGINPTDAEKLPPGDVRRIDRMEFHPKFALELSAFADRIESKPHELRHLIIGQRSLGRGTVLEPLPRRAAVGPLVREAIVGVGIYQGMEWILQRGMRDVLGHGRIGATRAACCVAGLRRAKVWSLTVGRDHEENWAALSQLLS